MSEMKWVESEKRIARRVFEAALQRELAAVLAELKERAAAAKKPEDIWSTEEYLTHMRREVDSKYDYRYSQLTIVFGKLLREGRIEERELEGLSADKLAHIRLIASL